MFSNLTIILLLTTDIGVHMVALSYNLVLFF